MAPLSCIPPCTAGRPKRSGWYVSWTDANTVHYMLIPPRRQSRPDASPFHSDRLRTEARRLVSSTVRCASGWVGPNSNQSGSGRVSWPLVGLLTREALDGSPQCSLQLEPSAGGHGTLGSTRIKILLGLRLPAHAVAHVLGKLRQPISKRGSLTGCHSV